MKTSWSNVKDSGDFLKQIKNLAFFPENVILVTAGVVGIYPGIANEVKLQTLEEELENRRHKQIPTDKLLKMAQFVLKITFLSLILMLSDRYL